MFAKIPSFEFAKIPSFEFALLCILELRNLPKESHEEIQIVETNFSLWKSKKWNRFSDVIHKPNFLL